MDDQSRMTAWPEGTKLLHVFGADGPHDSVIVVGTDAALRALRDAVDRALTAGRAAARGTLTRDGEGFWAFVIRATEAQMEEVPLHYQDTIYGDAGDPMPGWVDAATGDAAQEVIHEKQV
jgi:hypothetical protein